MAGCGPGFGKHDLAEALERRGYVRVTCVEARVKNFEIECVGRTRTGEHETICANCDADACVWIVLESNERGDVRRD
jgi:hypothetical protein